MPKNAWFGGEHCCAALGLLYRSISFNGIEDIPGSEEGGAPCVGAESFSSHCSLVAVRLRQRCWLTPEVTAVTRSALL